MRYVASEVSDSFNCPYSDYRALAHQTWYNVLISSYEQGKHPTTQIANDAFDRLEAAHSISEDEKEKIRFFLEAIISERIQPAQELEEGRGTKLLNLDLSRCFSCRKFSIWNCGTLIFPQISSAIAPNEDMAENIQRDFLEAGEILNRSPRGSAALLRLCVQKLCKHLGEGGKNINSDIASLVKKGLNVRIQQALDVVRVIGNESIHPGQIDLRDDHATACRLFELVNLIAEAMITQPKAIETLYYKLPQSKLTEIERRDKQT